MYTDARHRNSATNATPANALLEKTNTCRPYNGVMIATADVEVVVQNAPAPRQASCADRGKHALEWYASSGTARGQSYTE